MSKADLIKCVVDALNLFNPVNGGVRLSQKSFDSWHERCLAVLKNERPRTTGPLSQNHYINGAIMQIAQEVGDSFDDIKKRIKRDAMSAGYPFEFLDDDVEPMSESTITIREAAILIETINRIAAELNIELEGTWQQ